MVATSLGEILQDARGKRYAIGYLEVWNLESVRALVKAAEEEKSPTIIGFGGAVIDQWDGLEYYASLANAAVQKTKVPAASLLNEPSGTQQIIRGIQKGFMGVMIDGSNVPFQENVKLTKGVVDIAHSADVWVEGQIDELPTARNGELKEENRNITSPDKAKQFVMSTGVDALGISVGNVHGLYHGRAKLDLERIKQISDTVDIPLVLHGGSGIPDESVAEAAQLGICKVNVGVSLKQCFRDSIRGSLSERPEMLPEEAFMIAEEALAKLFRAKMRAYGSSGKAF